VSWIEHIRILKFSNQGESESSQIRIQSVSASFRKKFGVGSLVDFAESQIPFGMFFGCANAWGTPWEKALRRIGDF
jgi:hypothetical protein